MITVRAQRGEYTATVGRWRDCIGPNDILVIDREVLRHHALADVTEHTLPVTASEATKSLDFVASELLPFLQRAGASRVRGVVAVGGGVVQDVVGFACSVVMRGIPWRFAPSTLLAQCDSCIGSKTSLNFAGAKNWLGTYHPPAEIVLDPTLLASLDDAALASGCGEIAKIGLLSSADAFAILPELISAVLRREPAVTTDAVLRALEWKVPWIERDEFDRGPRRLLNLGHCYGHALEAASDFRVPHGIAVAYGILAAAALAARLGETEAGWTERVHALIAPTLRCDALVREADVSALCDSMRLDKKRESSGLAVVLPLAAGQARLATGLPDSIVAAAFDDMRSAL